MAKFMNYYQCLEREKPKSVSGSRFKPMYRLEVDDAGHEELLECGVTDVYADIQSQALSCDIHYILDKFRQTGDVSLIDKRQGIYTDITDAPLSYADMIQKMRDAEAMFYALKPEVRAEFNHDPQQFFASIGTDKFMEIAQKFGVGQKVEIVQDDQKGDISNEQKSE